MASTQPTRNKIKLLPEHLIDQIKAGEVVERPASLIKELLENSIDAGATKIDIHIIANGMELIQIDDNGIGMTFDDLPYAFGRHATSKIERYDDLFNLHSFGFRGEALASISAVSRITCTSTPAEEDLQGGKIIINGGKIESHSNYKSYENGTSIFIKDLFFNTPVRLKFLKSQTSEKNAISKIIHAFILSNPEIEFSLKFDDKDKQVFPAVSLENIEQRIRKIFYRKNKDESLIHFQKEYDNYRIHGFISKFGTGGYSGKKQFLFANGRFFQDKAIHQNIMRQAEALWGPGHSGHYVVIYEVPPHKIDVNIHPNKIQIKFEDNSLIYTLTSTSIKEAVKDSSHQIPRENQLPGIQNHDHPGSFSFGSSETFINQGNHAHDFPSFQEHAYERSQIQRDPGSKNIYPITSRFYLYDHETEGMLLLDIQSLLIHYWVDNIKDQPLLENVVSPLLITEPFQIPRGPVDEYLDTFKDLGFELERIEENLIVLRTIPTYLNATSYLPFLSRILMNLADEKDSVNHDNDWFINKLFELKEESLVLSPMGENQVKLFFNTFEIQELKKYKLAKTINDEFLTKFIQL